MQRNEPRLRAARLLNVEVVDPQGKMLGKVKDLPIDLARSEARYVVVKSGGAFGIGAKLFAFPMRDFGRGSRRGEAVLDIDEAKLKSAPGFASATSTRWIAISASISLGRRGQPQSAFGDTNHSCSLRAGQQGRKGRHHRRRGAEP